MAIKESLHHFVTDFKQWLAETYPGENRTNYETDCPSYPRWDEIDLLFTDMLKNNQVGNLDKQDKLNLLYLIACGWDNGHSLICWMDETRLSCHGDLKENDFLDLARTAAALDGKEYYDAKFQFASSFKKFPCLTIERADVLLALYENGDEYTKRTALHSLGYLNYPHILTLLEKSWLIDDVYHRMGCLALIDKYIKDNELMKKYLLIARSDTRKELTEYVKELLTRYPIR